MTGMVFPKVGIQYPKGGETLRIGKTYTIKWYTGNTTENVDLFLLKGGLSKGLIAKNVPNNGSCSWTVNKLLNGYVINPADDYRVKIKTRGNPPLVSISHAFIKIKPALVLQKKVKPKLQVVGNPQLVLSQKVDLTVTGIPKHNSSGGRYISYTIKNLNYSKAKLDNPVYMRIHDKANSSKKRTFIVFGWATLLNSFNDTGQYTANFPVPADWGSQLQLNIDVGKHSNDRNWANNIYDINY